MLGNFSCFCCRVLTIFKINFFQQQKFRNIIRVLNGLNPDPDKHVGLFGVKYGIKPVKNGMETCQI